MSKSVITDSLLTAIADAIRAKTGGQASMTPAEMAQEIAGISGANPPYAEYTFLQGGARVDAVLRGFSVIFNGMFSNSMSIQNVTCASDCNITSIEGEAFSFTRYITTFIIPATVETISSYAFRSSSGLREIKFLGTDTQKDTIVTEINSSEFTRKNKGTDKYIKIDTLIVNNQDWNEKYGGYLDIGLHDTMYDLLNGIIGAFFYSIVRYYNTKNKNMKMEVL